jgi:ribosome-associated translation inhibitor RaiA
MSVKLLPFGELNVQERGPDLFEAIDRAAGRLGRRFGRELDRIQRAKQKPESVRLAT